MGDLDTTKSAYATTHYLSYESIIITTYEFWRLVADEMTGVYLLLRCIGCRDAQEEEEQYSMASI